MDITWIILHIYRSHITRELVRIWIPVIERRQKEISGYERRCGCSRVILSNLLLMDLVLAEISNCGVLKSSKMNKKEGFYCGTGSYTIVGRRTGN